MAYSQGWAGAPSTPGCPVLFGGLSPWGATNFTYVGLTTTITLTSGVQLSGLVWYNMTALLKSEDQGAGLPWAPPPRYDAPFADDPVDGYLVLFGGRYGGADNSTLNDTWTLKIGCGGNVAAGTDWIEYDGWARLTTHPTPSSRADAQFAYDPTDKEMVLFGGTGASGTDSDTWTFLAGRWTELHPSVSPLGDFDGVMVNSSAGDLLVTGYGENQQVWTFAHDAWTKTAGSTPLGGRWAAGAALENSSGNFTLFGGLNTSTFASLGDTWSYSFAGGTWSEPLTPGTSSPAPRGSVAMTYDWAIGSVVLYGGDNTSGTFFADTWILATWPGDEVPFSVTLTIASPTPPPSQTVTPAQLPPNANVSLLATADGGVAPYTYYFSDAQHDQSGSSSDSTFFVIDQPENDWFTVVAVDAPDQVAIAGRQYTVGSVVLPDWQPARDAYSFSNFGSFWSTFGNCYGISTTEVLYWEHDILDYPTIQPSPTSTPETPYLPAPVGNTTNLSAPPGLPGTKGPGMNSTTLAITLHQTLDPANSIGDGPGFSASDMATSYSELLGDLEDGTPVILGLQVPDPGIPGGIGYHAVVAYGEWTSPAGYIEIATSDPNDAGITNIGTYYPSIGTFSLSTAGLVADAFEVEETAPQVETLQGSWLNANSWEYDSNSASYDTQGGGYELITSTVPLTVASNQGGTDDFSDWAGADTQSFVQGIPGSAGVEEPYWYNNDGTANQGTVQAYALPLGTNAAYSATDPSAGSSLVLDLRATNTTGQPTVRGYTANVTSTGEHDFTLTSDANGTVLRNGNEAVTLAINFGQVVATAVTAMNATGLAIPAGDVARFDVRDWSALASRSVPAVVVDLTTDGGAGETYQYTLANGQTGLGPGALVSWPVVFTESGLTEGSSWSVDVAGVASWSSTGLTLVANASNGSYDYSVVPANRSWAAPGGSFTVNGTEVELSVAFHLVTYPVTFEESGLPVAVLAKDGWTVGVGASFDRVRTASLQLELPNATYGFLVAGPAGELVSGAGAVPSGNLSVAGGPRSVGVIFEKGRTATLTVTERGLAAKQPWCVVLGGLRSCSAGRRLAFRNLTDPATYYLWVQSPLSGQQVTARLADGASFNVSGGAGDGVAVAVLRSTSVALSFAYDYAVTFTQSGLMSGTAWSVSVGGTNGTNPGGGPIVLFLANGTYPMRFAPEPGYKPLAKPAVLSVRGEPASVQVTFRPTR
jgi:hypothetical protein